MSIKSRVQKLTSCINGIWCLRASQRRSRLCAVIALFQVHTTPAVYSFSLKVRYCDNPLISDRKCNSLRFFQVVIKFNEVTLLR